MITSWMYFQCFNIFLKMSHHVRGISCYVIVKNYSLSVQVFLHIHEGYVPQMITHAKICKKVMDSDKYTIMYVPL
jgi:hypothetical protein